MFRTFALLTALSLPAAASADEIEDALNAALEAYQAGDTTFALEELEFARIKLQELKADALIAFLPPPPPGWTRMEDDDMGAALGMMGGGAGAAASYTPEGGGASVKITLLADNPMVAGMAAMVANAGAMGAKLERVNRQQFAIMDGQMTALVANRVLVQAEGGDEATMTMLLESMDFRALAGWGL
ncbi:MAG: hypothetical protein AAF618_12185 [Pseudomonadota bacterium]